MVAKLLDLGDMFSNVDEHNIQKTIDDTIDAESSKDYFLNKLQSYNSNLDFKLIGTTFDWIDEYFDGKKRKKPAREQRIRIDKIKEDAVCEIDAGAPTDGVIEKALYRHLSEIGDGKAKEKSAVSELVGTAFKTALISAFKKATPLLIATLVDGLKNNLNETEEDASSD